MINKYPQVSFIYDRRRIASPEQKAAVELRITYDGKQKYISTGVMLYPIQWKKGTIINCPDAVQISRTLDKLLSNVRNIILDMIEEENIDIMSIPARMQKKDKSLPSFIDFCKQRAIVRKYGKAHDSQIRYDRFIKFFRKWGKIKEFDDITDQMIVEYDRYLHSKKLKNSSIWNNYHRFLNSFIIDAVEAGYIQKNPYKWVKIDRRRQDSLSKCLSPDEFRKIKGSPMPTESLTRVRDLFVFQTYTCLSYTDLRDFDAKYIQEIKGMKVYVGSRQKTDKPFTIPLLSPAWDILMGYEGKLPVISNVKYNEYLKIVAQSAGIDKPISSHWARHTGATLLLNEGVDMKIVSKICGHSSIKITEQIYAKLLDETVVDAVSNLEI